MREIKFRAWDFIENMMMDASELSYGIQYNKNKVEIISQKDCFVFLQYTGLKDKNGVEIYEGDIVKGNYLKGIGVVEWNKYFCKFDISHRMNISPSDEFEVIGNIYENLELLNNEKS